MTETIVNANGNASDVNKVDNTEVMDEFGRTQAERSVELSPRDAEMIDHEVTEGGHDTYDDALHYVLTHGFKEVQRTRKAAAELKAARVIKEHRKLYSAMLQANPKLVADADFVNKMIAELGVKAK
jgi:hypothetical protein